MPWLLSRRLPILIILVGLAGCGMFHRNSPDAAGSVPVLYSPNGEALSGGPLGRPSCTEAMARWFDRVDTNHDRAIELDEYLADARRQFAAMDLDKDGVLTPDELAKYRYPYVSAAAAEAKPAARQNAGEDRAPQSASDLPDPVMAADVNLRNQVSLADFLAYARREFAGLNQDGSGRLAKAEVLRLCK